ncbi:MAG: hypothetical protein ABIS50_03855 [Luteolibacter sp.]|uniref:hypothetical protein n=1 Tax=Luteolibacter sp. TaxID=1962973 RepID=UPI003264E11A
MKQKIELSRLAENIRKIEELIKSGIDAGTEFSLKGQLLNEKSQYDAVVFEERMVEATTAEKTRDSAAIAYLVTAETRLNAEEKMQYGEFLKQDFFTKSDFEKLDKFYVQTWDKLSDEGKSQMSHRVWEGIRHHEYTFDELPENLRKKESDYLYQQMTGQKPAGPEVGNFLERDKADFIREYESGDRKAATEILSRHKSSENIYSRNESSTVEDSLGKVNQSDDPPEGEEIPAKEKATTGLELQAGISEVKDSDGITVPQIRAFSPGRTRGG